MLNALLHVRDSKQMLRALNVLGVDVDDGSSKNKGSKKVKKTQNKQTSNTQQQQQEESAKRFKMSPRNSQFQEPALSKEDKIGAQDGPKETNGDRQEELLRLIQQLKNSQLIRERISRMQIHTSEQALSYRCNIVELLEKMKLEEEEIERLQKEREQEGALNMVSGEDLEANIDILQPSVSSKPNKLAMVSRLKNRFKKPTDSEVEQLKLPYSSRKSFARSKTAMKRLKKHASSSNLRISSNIQSELLAEEPESLTDEEDDGVQVGIFSMAAIPGPEGEVQRKKRSSTSVNFRGFPGLFSVSDASDQDKPIRKPGDGSTASVSPIVARLWSISRGETGSLGLTSTNEDLLNEAAIIVAEESKAVDSKIQPVLTESRNVKLLGDTAGMVSILVSKLPLSVQYYYDRTVPPRIIEEHVRFISIPFLFVAHYLNQSNDSANLEEITISCRLFFNLPFLYTSF